MRRPYGGESSDADCLLTWSPLGGVWSRGQNQALCSQPRLTFCQHVRCALPLGSIDIRLGSQADILQSAFAQQIQRTLVPQAALNLQEKQDLDRKSTRLNSS